MAISEQITNNKIIEYSHIFDLGRPVLRGIVSLTEKTTREFCSKYNYRFVDFISTNKEKFEVHSEEDFEYLVKRFEGIPTVVVYRPDAMWVDGIAYWDGSKITKQYLSCEDSHLYTGNLGRLAKEPQLITVMRDKIDLFLPQYLNAVNIRHQNCETGPTYIYIKTAACGEDCQDVYLYEFGYGIPQIAESAIDILESNPEAKVGASLNFYDAEGKSYLIPLAGSDVKSTWRSLYMDAHKANVRSPYYRTDGAVKANHCFNKIVNRGLWKWS